MLRREKPLRQTLEENKTQMNQDVLPNTLSTKPQLQKLKSLP